MARFKEIDRSPRFLPVVLEAQIQPGSFEYALDYLVDHELDLSGLAGRYRNDGTGAPAYDPAVMLKIVLLAYSRGMVSSRAIERACRENVLFIAISGDNAPQFTTIAKFVRELGSEIAALFQQVLMTCDAQGLIGRHMFAIDGVKLSSNASKFRSGTHDELAHRAERMEQAVARMLDTHRQRDVQTESADGEAQARQRSIERLQSEARRIRNFLLTQKERKSAKGAIRKSNVTDNDSAKMATSKGVLQGYTAIVAVDSQHQVIVAAQAHGSGSEQTALLPMVRSTDGWRTNETMITADAGYHSEVNLKELHEAGIPALIADGMMRKRDERFKDQAKYKAAPDPLYDKTKVGRTAKSKLFRPADFQYDAASQSCICPAGRKLYSNGSQCQVKGRTHHKFTGAKQDCMPCALRAQCLRYPERTPVRQVAFFYKEPTKVLPHAVHTHRMRQAIDSDQGRALYGRRMATVEPVFGNLRANKRLDRFTLRGQAKVNTQWHLYCLVHNIEKLAHHGYAS
jgi:transposase